MQIDGKLLADALIDYTHTLIQKDLTTKGIVPTLVDFCVTPKADDWAFIKMKQKIAQRVGVNFVAKIYETIPRYMQLVKDITNASQDKSSHSIIIQRPLPPLLDTSGLTKAIPIDMDIESKNPKSLYTAPIALATMTILKHIYMTDSCDPVDFIYNPTIDNGPMKKILRNKKIVVVGKGQTGGGPICQFLTKTNISFVNLTSKTPDPAQYLKNADIIISAVGKKVITADMIKSNVVLLTAGLRFVDGKWKGDFDEDEIREKAAHFTPTPGGIGPLDVAFVCYNTYLAALHKFHHPKVTTLSKNS